MDSPAEARTVSSAQVLGEIERVGWRLEQTGYVFVMTGQSSSERMFLSGEETAVSGKTFGIYLFRNPGASTGPSAVSPPR